MRFRRKYLIYPKFQLTLLLANAAALIVFFVITLFFIGISFSEMLKLGQTAGLPADHVYFRFLEVQSHSLITNLVFALLVSLVGTSVFFLFLSHRLVGPIVGLISYLKRYRESRSGGPKPPPLKFRKKDYFHDLAESVNDVLP